MRIFRDSVNAPAIPLDGCQGVLLYANGRFAATAADTERFTTAGIQVAHIDVNGTAWELAAVLDVEAGDAGPAQAPGWIRNRNSFRSDAAVYCGLDNCPALFAATARLSGSYYVLIADWTGQAHIPAITLPANVKLLGCQYASFENYDESCITADGWHPAPERKTA